MESNIAELLLVKYWPQFTLVLVGIAYFIQRFFDYKAKKVEINHSIFQQNRIDAVNRFFVTYNEAQRMWHQLLVYDVIDAKKVDGKELDGKVQPKVNAVKLSLLELRFYFETDTYQLFDQIEKGLASIYTMLSIIRGASNPAVNEIVKANQFESTKAKTFGENDKLITKLCDLIRKDFKTSL